MMNPGEYDNRLVANRARQNIKGRMAVRPLFSSRAGVIFAYALLFSVPGAFIALGLILFALGARAKDGVGALLFFGFLMLIPCGSRLGVQALAVLLIRMSSYLL